MNTTFWIIVGVGLALIFLFTGCTSVGKPMRFKPVAGVAAADSWYIESKPTNGVPPFSCSFVEFDGRGDYIDFNQHAAAWNKVKELAEAQKILLVFYCHGWKNNSQSGDVVEFNEFLGRLAASPAVGDFGYRVHGIYLGWRGNLYRPYVNKGNGSEDNGYRRMERDFGGPIVNADRHRRFYWTAWVQEQLSYWSRRNAAEHKVSSVPIARTIFTCASLAKAIDRNKDRTNRLEEMSRVMVMGHSFGALLLERALNATCLDPLTDQWTWFEKQKDDKEKLQESEKSHAEKLATNPLPLDFVLFVNSAAPAIYAKTMRDFLSAHQHALQRGGSLAANTPVFVSITSSADKATRCLHPLANVFSRCYPSLQHTYTNLVKIPEDQPRRVHQSAFYNRTAGHQPLLLDHWLVEGAPLDSDPTNHQGIINANLNYNTDDPLTFLAQRSGKPGNTRRWTFSLQPPGRKEKDWAEQFGLLEPHRSSYWFIRCDHRLIRDHNDVWSDTAMQLYTGLYRMVEWTRVPTNQAKVKPLFDQYWSGN